MSLLPQRQATCQAQYQQSVSQARSTREKQFLTFFTAVGYSGDLALLECAFTEEGAPFCIDMVELAYGGPSLTAAVGFEHQYNTAIANANAQLQACQNPGPQ
jgi:hypothetical protein